jgi:uncharacterized membrane protein YfcA
MLTIAALCCFAFLAGFIDAMVGGGGLVQLPAMFLLLPQFTLAQTLATNKTANFLGTTVSAIQYMKKVKIEWYYLVAVMITAFAGSFGGALLVSHITKEDFMPVIIVVLLLVLAYTIWKKHLGLHHEVKLMGKTKVYLYGSLIGLIIGFYDGLIGPGTGSFLIFAFIIVFGYNFLHASANAKIINWVTNIAAISFFLFGGHIMWHIAIPVGLANMAGSYAGSHLAMKKGSSFIRLFFIAVVLCLVIKLGYSYL